MHACCAPCSSYVLEYLSKYFEISVFFFNPNIYPKGEFDYRADEITRLINEMKPDNVDLIIPEYNEMDFFNMTKGMEHVREGGERSFKCYELRLEKTAQYAKEMQFDYFTTTLTISPLKNSGKINEIGRELSEKYGVQYLYSDFKKKEGYNRSIELSKEYNLYRQNYCGCVDSKNQNPSTVATV